MSFTDQKPFVLTEEQSKLRWGGGLWCNLCGYSFKAGDTLRFLFSGGKGCPNFKVCTACDGDNEAVIVMAKASYELAIKLARQWGIYGPDWQDDMQRAYAREQ